MLQVPHVEVAAHQVVRHPRGGVVYEAPRLHVLLTNDNRRPQQEERADRGGDGQLQGAQRDVREVLLISPSTGRDRPALSPDTSPIST